MGHQCDQKGANVLWTPAWRASKGAFQGADGSAPGHCPDAYHAESTLEVSRILIEVSGSYDSKP